MMQHSRVFQILILMVFPMLIIAQSKVQTSVQISIVSPVSLEENEQLRFGNFAVKKSGGSIQLTPQGERIVNGDIQLLAGEVDPAIFRFSANQSQVVSLKLPDVPIQLHNQANDQNILVDLFISNLALGGIELDNREGYIEVNVGATLNVGDMTKDPKGIFSGVYEAVFTFN